MKPHAVLFVLTVAFGNCAIATVTPILNQGQWQSAVGAHSLLTFTDLPFLTTVTNQYANLGITFTDGNDFIHSSPAFSDGRGLASVEGFGNLGRIRMEFAQPQDGLAFEYTGDIVVELYSRGQLIFTSDLYVAAFSPFVGFVSTTPIDAANRVGHHG